MSATIVYLHSYLQQKSPPVTDLRWLGGLMCVASALLTVTGIAAITSAHL